MSRAPATQALAARRRRSRHPRDGVQRLATGVGLLVLCLVAAASPAEAQPMNPHGAGGASKPSPAAAVLDDDLAVGTVSVQAVQGEDSEPVSGIDVRLEAAAGQGGRRVARTDSTGVARFTGLEVGDSYQVAATVGGVPRHSEPFEIPQSGGVSVVLSPEDLAALGRGGRPDPRQMSGIARPQKGDPGGQLTVRPMLGDFRETMAGLVSDVPTGARVHLVGVRGDGTATVETHTVEAENDGRIRFTGLNRSNRVTYYLLSLFDRPGGRDRLVSQPVHMLPEVGMRLMLAGQGRDSASGPVDDFSEKFSFGNPAPPAGEARVRLFMAPRYRRLLDSIDGVELVDLTDPDAEARTARVAQRAASREETFGQSVEIKPRSGTGPGQVSVFVVRPSLDRGLGDVTVAIRRADAAEAGEVVATERTKDDGLALFGELEADVEYVLTAEVNGRAVESASFEIDPERGRTFAFAFEWPREDLFEARFEDLATGPEHVYMARTEVDGRTLTSPPFQLTDSLGATAPIFVYPPVLFGFHGGATLDDERLWFEVQVALINPAMSPYDPGRGLSIPLPQGFVGASVADEMASRVKIESDKGLLWRGPVPPGRKQFVARFALPVDGGEVDFDMDLPHGMMSGQIILDDIPGMSLDVPDDAKIARLPGPGQPPRPDGKKFVALQDIRIEAGRALVFRVRGLPQKPAWKRYVRWGVGGVVALLLLWGFSSIFIGSRGRGDHAVRRALELERDRLLDQLAELEADKQAARLSKKSYDKRRRRLLGKLEDLYQELDGDSGTTKTQAG